MVDDAVPYSFKLINEFHLPFAGIKVKFFSPFSTINELSGDTEYELMPGSGITRETTLVCHYRGEYEIGIKEVVVTDYFRLFSISYKNKDCRRVTVDPQLVRLESLGSFQMQTQDSLIKADKLDVVSREYVLGDDVRFINWSQTARTGTLMTRERTGEEGNGIALVMDACRYSDDPYVYLPVENKVLELTIAIAMFFCDKGIGVTEWHPVSADADTVANHIQSKQQFENFYQQMAAIAFDKNNTQESLFGALIRGEDITNSAAVYMVLSRWTKAAGDMTEKLAKRNISTVVYLISEDMEQKPDISRPDLVEIITVSPEARLEEVIK